MIPRKRNFLVLLALGLLALGGCVMAARKGAQRLEERDGPVGQLLNETKQDLRPGAGSEGASEPAD